MRRRLKPEQRRALIVDAAAQEFGRRGHRDARLEDIAHAAGTTKAVIYDHFPDKGALHAEVVARASADLLAHVGAVVAEHAGDDPRTRFRAGVVASFAIILERPDVQMLLLGAPGAPPEVAKTSVGALRTSRAAMAEIYLAERDFLRGHPQRRRRAELLAQGMIGMINGFAALGIEQDLGPEQLADAVMDLVWPGIEALMRPR